MPVPWEGLGSDFLTGAKFWKPSVLAASSLWGLFLLSVEQGCHLTAPPPPSELGDHETACIMQGTERAQ